MSDNDIENPHANYNPKPVNDGHTPTPKGVMGRVQRRRTELEGKFRFSYENLHNMPTLQGTQM